MEKIEQYKAMPREKDIYDSKELMIEKMSQKINEIVEWINDLEDKFKKGIK